MKFRYNSLLLIVVCMLILPCYGSNFKSSKEAELEELLHYFQSLEPEKSKEQLHDEVNIMLPSNMYKHETFDNLHARLGSSDNRIKDIANTFHVLKLKMHLPQDIELYFLSDSDDRQIEEEALYNGIERRLYLSNNFFRSIPSSQLCSLIHECVHIQQHQRMGLRKHKETKSFMKEQEADTHAIQVIKCPVCIQLIEYDWRDVTEHGTYRPDHGYLSRAEIEKYKLEKKDSDICKAHAKNSIDAQKLRELMKKDSQPKKLTMWQKIFGSSKTTNNVTESEKLKCFDLDQNCSTLEDRLSTVRFEE